MPLLPWRNDADGFAFANSWTLDATERAGLSALVQPVVAGAVATLGSIVPDPIFVTTLIVAAEAAMVLVPSPGIGLCGGMAYASLDYWNARALLPRGAHRADQPVRATGSSGALRDFIWSRLLTSLLQGRALHRTLEWSLLLNQVPPFLGGGAGTLLQKTNVEWNNVKNSIDAGRPCPIALVYSNRSVWQQHQILVYGYEDPGDGTGTLYVYDSNHPKGFNDTDHGVVTLNFGGPTLTATTPSDVPGGGLMGFFVTNYVQVSPPAKLAENFGEFMTWAGDSTTWMVARGARMAVADAAELQTLGGSPADVRSSPTSMGHEDKGKPRDGALFREKSDNHVYLYQGGAPFWIPDPDWLERFGGWSAVQTVPDGSLQSFIGLPEEGTLLREYSDPKVYRMMAGQRHWVTTPTELNKYGGFPTVRLVPDGALAGIPVGVPLPEPGPGECEHLRQEIATLDAAISRLTEMSSEVDDLHAAARIRAQIARLGQQRAAAQARRAALNCP